jgi:hypothetical protein
MAKKSRGKGEENKPGGALGRRVSLCSPRTIASAVAAVGGDHRAATIGRGGDRCPPRGGLRRNARPPDAAWAAPGPRRAVPWASHHGQPATLVEHRRTAPGITRDSKLTRPSMDLEAQDRTVGLLAHVVLEFSEAGPIPPSRRRAVDAWLMRPPSASRARARPGHHLDHSAWSPRARAPSPFCDTASANSEASSGRHAATGHASAPSSILPAQVEARGGSSFGCCRISMSERINPGQPLCGPLRNVDKGHIGYLGPQWSPILPTIITITTELPVTAGRLAIAHLRVIRPRVVSAMRPRVEQPTPVDISDTQPPRRCHRLWSTVAGNGHREVPMPRRGQG